MLKNRSLICGCCVVNLWILPLYPSTGSCSMLYWMNDINSLGPVKYGSDFWYVISKHMLWIKFMSIYYGITFGWHRTRDGMSTLVQVMAWRCWGQQAISWANVDLDLQHHIGITRPQWVNTLRSEQYGCHLTEDIFKLIFLYENCILIKISRKFFLKVQLTICQHCFR